MKDREVIDTWNFHVELSFGGLWGLDRPVSGIRPLTVRRAQLRVRAANRSALVAVFFEMAMARDT